MSRCRCEDIQDCEIRKRRLNKLLDRLEPYRSWHGVIADKVDEIYHYSAQGMENIQISSIHSKMEYLHEDMDVLYRNMTYKLQNAMDWCQHEINAMQAEDSAYHEEQRRILAEKLAYERKLRAADQTTRESYIY